VLHVLSEGWVVDGMMEGKGEALCLEGGEEAEDGERTSTKLGIL
jgi:hypothetical protein